MKNGKKETKLEKSSFFSCFLIFKYTVLVGVPKNMPDISKMHFNKLNGMGTREENQELRIKREEAREQRPIKPIKVWDIWNKGTNEEGQRVELIQDKFRRNIKEINEKNT